MNQARDGEDGLSVERRDSLGKKDEDGISRRSLILAGAGRGSFYGASGLLGSQFLRAKQPTLRRFYLPLP